MKKPAIILFIAIVLSSCETDVPETDTTAPKFQFEIRGDGFGQTFTEEDNYSNFQLNLRNSQTYTITYVGGDAGGLKRMQWQYAPTENIEFENLIESPWTHTHISSLSSVVAWNGDRENPLNGFIFSNHIQINCQNTSLPFVFILSDFGGESGISNTTSAELNIFVGDHDTEIINF